MNKLTVILLAASLTAGSACKKHSTGGGAVPKVDSIIIYSPVDQKMEIETFQFNGQQLAVFTDYNTDTVSGTPNAESRVHYFSYEGSNTYPVSVRITDTGYSNGNVSIYGAPFSFVMQYDSRGRLIADTIATTVPEEFNWSFDYTGDSVYVFLHYTPTSSNVWDQFLVSGGNLNGYRRENVLSRGPNNPLYDGAIGGSYWPYLLCSPPIFQIPIGFDILPVDFVSRQLPLQVNDPGDNTQLDFSWQTDSSGRVVSGEVSGYETEPVQIWFKYSGQ
jgi:hypothetical protein